MAEFSSIQINALVHLICEMSSMTWSVFLTRTSLTSSAVGACTFLPILAFWLVALPEPRQHQLLPLSLRTPPLRSWGTRPRELCDLRTSVSSLHVGSRNVVFVQLCGHGYLSCVASSVASRSHDGVYSATRLCMGATGWRYG